MSSATVDVVELFCVPLIHFTLEDDTDELKTCSDFVSSHDQARKYNDLKNFTTQPNFRILEKFPKTKDILTRASNAALNKFHKFSNEFMISTSWLTKTKKGQGCNLHDHKNCVFSGVYYYGDYDDDVGNITFRNPFVDMSSYMLNSYEPTLYNQPFMEIKPQDKSLIIFPSYLKHMIVNHKSEITRHSLAFNLVPINQYGNSDSLCDTQFLINN